MTFLTYLLNGLQAGSIYALIALGYTMVYGIVKLINFAHGDVMMLGAYVALFCLTTFHLPLWATVLVTMLVTAIIGVVIERFAYKPLRNSARISALITAIGISLLLQNLVMLIFSPQSPAVPGSAQICPGPDDWCPESQLADHRHDCSRLRPDGDPHPLHHQNPHGQSDARSL